MEKPVSQEFFEHREYLSARLTRIDNQATEGEKSYPAIVLTESPIPREFEDGSPYTLYVLLDGMNIPDSLPLNNRHMPTRAKDTIGTVDKFQAVGNQFLGAVRVSDAEPKYQKKVADGTLPALSLGFNYKAKFIPEGKQATLSSKSGVRRTFQGPAMVALEQFPFEVALTAHPGDKNARIQRETLNRFVVSDNPTRSQMDEVKTASEVKPEVKTETLSKETPKVDVEAVKAEARKQERELLTGIRKLCEAQDRADLSEELCGTCKSVEEAGIALLNRIAEGKKTNRPQASVNVVGEGRDRQYASQRDAFVAKQMLSMQWNDKSKVEHLIPKNVDKRFFHMGLYDHTRALLEAKGFDCAIMPRAEMYQTALLDAGYNDQGNLSNITQDAAKLVALGGYLDAPTSYQDLVEMLPPTPDLKDIHQLDLSGIGYATDWEDGDDPAEHKLKDSDQTIKVTEKADNYSITWHTLINDRLGMILKGIANCTRGYRDRANRDFFTLLASNQAFSDGIAFFDVNTHKNYVSTGAVPDSDGLNVGMKTLATQTLLDGRPTNIVGQYLVGPRGMYKTIFELCHSTADPSANQSGVANPWSKLIPITDGQLDILDQYAWYILPSQAMSPIAMAYLEGQETPMVTTFVHPTKHSLTVSLMQGWAMGYTDYRRGFKNAGH